MAFLAVPLKDPGHCLAIRGRFRGGLELGYRAADGCDVSRLHLVALEQGGDRVLELVARGIGVANPTLRELVVDATVVAHTPLRIDHEGLGRHRCADLSRECALAIPHYWELQVEVAGVGLQVRVAEVGIDADPHPLHGLRREGRNQGAKRGAVGVGDGALGRVEDQNGEPVRGSGEINMLAVRTA